ncbi:MULTISPECIES: SPJ_0845 family protein [Streptococcus]|uniref:SPJ_0845 family protein n=1 Tax=Streptococcus caledonicus TaxID=2614158 RepID=A0ABW0UCS9_9STRE|nr:SPJ_0845 family protein [Streptococcus sp. S784/96/1]
MALTYKKQDELEKVLESFAKLPDLENVTFPELIKKEEAHDKK